jgi:16S rRNA A1518/A1519 N6-dimethyltransferase RsmA/KsgA/DIM1 with predicted DNA glycosylase/AP lyase activity
MDMMALANISPESRATELQIEDFVRLARAYEQLKEAT